MADYLIVPFTQSSSDDGFYLSGVTAYSRQEIGVWKVAYKADTAHTIRMGCYRSGSSTFDFVFVSETALYGLDIRLVSPTAQALRSIQSIWMEIGQDYGGYYNHFALQIDEPIINYTVFTKGTWKLWWYPCGKLDWLIIPLLLICGCSILFCGGARGRGCQISLSLI